ncbi:replication initiation protein [Helicobacter gastrocanis]|uniref:replication initiation protein n=1 Tax=Helicobacter gastrocanis TaxID=2849641 RepID=UPI001C849D65|nr:replication initiation protein [Helicobacter sp. NHP19-003]
MVLAHEWESNDTSSINTSQQTKDTLKHFSTLMASLQEMLDNAPSPTIKEGLEFGIKDCIDKMEGALTAWTEWIDPKDKPKDTIPITEFTKPQSAKPQEENTPQPQPQEPPQEVAKEVVAQEPQTALAPIVQEPQDLQKQGLLAPQNAPSVPGKSLSIANKSQIVMHNNIYKVNLGHLSELETNLLFNLCHRLKDKQDTLVTYTAKEIRAFAGDPKMSNKNLLKLSIDLVDNLIKANFRQIAQVDGELTLIRTATIFSVFEVGVRDRVVEFLNVQVNAPHFTYLLNELSANFTAMRLSTYMSLSGKYPKNLFRLLERYKNEAVDGVFQVHMYQNDLEGFCAFMGVPKDFRKDNIDAYVLNPAIKKLTQKSPKKSFTPPYKSIKVIKNKAKAQGAKVLGYTFEVTLNTPEQEQANELEKGQEPHKKPKRFTKQDIKALNDTIGMQGALIVKDQEGKDFALNYACVVDFVPSPKTRGICIQFRVNGVLNPKILAIIALYKKHEGLGL